MDACSCLVERRWTEELLLGVPRLISCYRQALSRALHHALKPGTPLDQVHVASFTQRLENIALLTLPFPSPLLLPFFLALHFVFSIAS